MNAASSVQWERFGDHRCLVISFEGKLEVKDAKAKMKSITAAIEAAGEPVAMVWDAARMTGYESEARKLWQDGLKRLRPQIRAIHLVSDSAVIRMGASVVGMFLGLEISSWPTRAAVRIAQ